MNDEDSPREGFQSEKYRKRNGRKEFQLISLGRDSLLLLIFRCFSGFILKKLGLLSFFREASILIFELDIVSQVPMELTQPSESDPPAIEYRHLLS